MNRGQQYTFLISEADIVGNKGAVAMTLRIINELDRRYKGSQFIVTTKFPTEARQLIKTSSYNIQLLPDNDQAFDLPLVKLWIWWLFKKIHINQKSLLKNNVLKAYDSADLIISTSGVSFIDDFGFIKIYHFTKYLQIPLLLGKKTIKFTQSIGPFRSLYNRCMARLTLPFLDCIIARGNHTVNSLSKIGIKNNVVNLPDIVFTLPPKYSKPAKEIVSKIKSSNIIGFCPNIVCKRLDTKNVYIESLVQLAKNVLNKYPDSSILLIPHTITEKHMGKNDDLEICKQIADQIGRPDRVFVENTILYTPNEIKWLIAQCSFFVGSRFHALVAALSSAVPCLAIGWELKYEELMDWVQIENNVLYYWNLTPEIAITMFTELYQKRKQIKQELEKKLPIIRQLALSAFDIIEELLLEKD